MKEIGNYLLDLLIGAWLVVAIFVTVCLLSYNEFKVTSFGKNSLLIIDDDSMEPEFTEGDLLIVKRNSDNNINVGDRIFYYNSTMTSNVFVYLDAVMEKIPVTRDETTFVLNDQKVSGEYIIGKANDAKIIHKLGTFLGILTSRWGFMFLVIFPTLFAIIYEIVIIFETSHEIKLAEKYGYDEE